MGKRRHIEITEDDPRLFDYLQPFPRAQARWNDATKDRKENDKQENENGNSNKKKATSKPYLNKGGVKAKDKIPKRRRVVPELREVGYRDTAAQVWKDRVSKVVKDSCDYVKHSDFPMHSRKISKKSPGNLPLIQKKKKLLHLTIRKFVQAYITSHFLHDDLILVKFPRRAVEIFLSFKRRKNCYISQFENSCKRISLLIFCTTI